VKVTFNPITLQFQLVEDTAAEIMIEDAGELYNAENVEDALQEIALNTLNALGYKLSDAPSDGSTYGRNNGQWVTITAGSSLPVADSTIIVTGSADATKKLRFEVDGFTAGQTRVLTPPDADVLLAGQNYANVFTADQQISAHAAVGVDSDVSNPGQSLPVYVGSVFSAPLSIEEEFSSNPSGITYVRNTLGFLHVNPSTNAPETYFAAADFQAHTSSGNDKDIVVMEGVYGYAWHQGSGDITSLAGLEFYAYNSGAGNVYAVYGITANAYHDGSGTVENLYGEYIGIYIAGSTTNAYGLYIDPVSGATNNYAIYTDAGLVSLGDNLFLRTIKSGATQAGAGAAAGEVWKTASHATLPNNVLMIGV
jgi:hypothetical protein